jgi:hypothetical protein
MADLITRAQFEARLGGRTLTAAEQTQVDGLITDASALAVDIISDSTITADWDVETVGTVPAAVVPVVVAMVRRGLDNPLGFTSERQGEYSYQGASSAGVFATDAEARALRRIAGRGGISALDLTADLPGLASTPIEEYLEGAFE